MGEFRLKGILQQVVDAIVPIMCIIMSCKLIEIGVKYVRNKKLREVPIGIYLIFLIGVGATAFSIYIMIKFIF